MSCSVIMHPPPSHHPPSDILSLVSGSRVPYYISVALSIHHAASSSSVRLLRCLECVVFIGISTCILIWSLGFGFRAHVLYTMSGRSNRWYLLLFDALPVILDTGMPDCLFTVCVPTRCVQIAVPTSAGLGAELSGLCSTTAARRCRGGPLFRDDHRAYVYAGPGHTICALLNTHMLVAHNSSSTV
ncbi:hypothetical protein OH76DRAFT_260651 [Lentinus brumalis]|uniref:Uncharacterized protein n=1 Tax=Lentinus brumalis TaxID=2498619 RepID=A0A371DGJ5_9APHY|nr:hypothetical protein OH76DRAFT_260651 [Polyporus brumalis]